VQCGNRGKGLVDLPVQAVELLILIASRLEIDEGDQPALCLKVEVLPAVLSSAAESAACRMTSACCTVLAPPVLRLPLCSASTGFVREAIHAGAIANKIPVTVETVSANPSAGSEGLALSGLISTFHIASASIAFQANKRLPAQAHTQPCQYQRFDEHLPHEPPPRRSQGRANAQPLLSSHAAQQHQAPA
jgi:hypothetical protein